MNGPSWIGLVAYANARESRHWLAAKATTATESAVISLVMRPHVRAGRVEGKLMKFLGWGISLILAIVLAAVLALRADIGSSSDPAADRAKAEKLRPALCTKENDRALSYAFGLRTWGKGYANIDVRDWSQVDWEVRELGAAWVCICKLDGESIALRDSRTHETLATYSPTLGYRHEK